MDLLQKAGVIAMGIFVGMLMALALSNTKLSVRTGLSIIGATLGGVPIAFLGDSGSRWFYPLGLLIGFVWHRVFRRTGASPNSSPPPNLRKYLPELVSSAVVVLAITILAAITPGSGLTQSGEIELNLPESTNRITIYYPEPFGGSPHLDIHGPATFELLEQRPDYFMIRLESWTTSRKLRWTATGVRRDAKPR